MMCKRLHTGHLSVHVEDSLQHHEETVENLELCLSVRLLVVLLLSRIVPLSAIISIIIKISNCASQCDY